MKTEHIKSCPFCGSDRVEIARANEDACWVSCAKCGSEGDYHKTRDGAIRKWNRRKEAKPAIVTWDQDHEWKSRNWI